MNKLSTTLTFLVIHIIILGFAIGLGFWDANQKIYQFDRSPAVTWPAALVLAWILYFYVFYIFYVVVGLKSANSLSVYSVIVLAFFLSVVQIFFGIPALALAVMPADFALKPIVRLMKSHAAGSAYKSEKPYLNIADANVKESFTFDRTTYRLTTNRSDVELCNDQKKTCLHLPRFNDIAGSKRPQFFQKDHYLYISLPNVGIWKINAETFQHDLNFVENIRQGHDFFSEKDYTGDSQFYLMQVKPDHLVLRYGLWVYATDLSGANPRPLAVDRANGLEIDNY